MDRKDFYFKQRLTQAELDAGFTYVETSEKNFRVDNALSGVVSGLVPTLVGDHVQITITKGVAYDPAGKRIVAFTDGAASKTINFQTPTGGVLTNPATGNDVYLSIYAMAGRQALDSRVDGNGVTVYHDQPECLHDGTSSAPANVAGLGGTGVDKFLIVYGTAAATGTATKPALRTDAVLLCDLLRVGNAGVGTISGGVDVSRVTTPFSTFRGGRTNPSKGINQAISRLIDDLGSQVPGDDGAERIGSEVHGWLTTGSVASQLAQIGVDGAQLSAALNTFTGTQRLAPGAVSPALDTAALTTSVRRLLFEGNFGPVQTGTTGKFRIYLNFTALDADGPNSSLLLTWNAKWNDGTQRWNNDDFPVPAQEVIALRILEIGGQTTSANLNAPIKTMGSLRFIRHWNGGNVQMALTDAQLMANGQVFFWGALGSNVTNDGAGPLGTNKFNPITCRYTYGMTSGGTNADIAFFDGVRGKAVAASDPFGGTVDFRGAFTGTPSSTVSSHVRGANTTSGVGGVTVTAVDTESLDWSDSATAAGNFNKAVKFLVRL